MREYAVREFGIFLRRLGPFSHLILALSLMLIACGEEKAAPPQTPTPDPILTRPWPEVAPLEATALSARPGQMVPAGGVEGGRWVASRDALRLAHAGSPGEGNLLRVWHSRKGAWERIYALPFTPKGAMGFSADGQAVAVVGEGGVIWVYSGLGKPARVKKGGCTRISQIQGIPEGGWVVAGPGGCVARYKAGRWKMGPDTGVNIPLALQTLTKGEPVLAGISTQGRAKAVVWWPDGVVKSLRSLGDLDADGEKKKGDAAQEKASALVELALLEGSKTPKWANITPTLTGALYVAIDGLPLTAFDASTGRALNLALPRVGPWNPLVGAGVSADGSQFYVLRQDGMLFGGPTGLFEATWKSKMPLEAGQSPSLLAASQGLLVLKGEMPIPLATGPWQTLPSPPPITARPWQPQSLRFGNNGQSLAITYASPSVGGTSRWITFWNFDGLPPRRVALGTWKHESGFESLIKTGMPNTPLAVNGGGSLYAVAGPTGIQLYETSTTVKAGRIAQKGALDVVFGQKKDQIFYVDPKGQLMAGTVDGPLPKSPWADLPHPIIDLAADADGSHIAVLTQGEGEGLVRHYATGKRRRLGEMKVKKPWGKLALASQGGRGFLTIPQLGLVQYPRGRAVIRAKDEGDRFSGVRFHPRSVQALFSGQDYGLYQWTRAGKAVPWGTLSGEVRDMAYHPLGKCVALALSSGRVEIRHGKGLALALELWEGDRFLMWTPSGGALGSDALLKGLRIYDGQTVYQPIRASSSEVKKAIKGACGG